MLNIKQYSQKGKVAKVYFEIKIVKRDQEGQVIMIKRLIQKEIYQL